MPESFFNEVAGPACHFIKKGALAQVFFCEFCEISKNTLFAEHAWVTASRIISTRIYAIHHIEPRFRSAINYYNMKQ